MCEKHSYMWQKVREVWEKWDVLKKTKEVLEVWVMWHVPKMWVVQRNVRSKSKKCEKKLEVWKKLICVRKVIEMWDIEN